MKLVRAMFSRRWLLATILAVAGAALCIRLGFWQLDRLEKRLDFNARVSAQQEASLLELSGEAIHADLYNMEYRQVKARGRYDFAHQIALRNQYWGSEWGAHLVTPLIMTDSNTAVLVDRGWIPAQDFEAGDWSKYDEPGEVQVMGILRRPQTKAEIGNRSDPTPVPGSASLKTWFFINIEAIADQTPYELLPAYIQQAPEPERTILPYRTQPKLELSEGPHMGYALQWFTFAALLAGGYPFFVRRQQTRPLDLETSDDHTR